MSTEITSKSHVLEKFPNCRISLFGIHVSNPKPVFSFSEIRLQSQRFVKFFYRIINPVLLLIYTTEFIMYPKIIFQLPSFIEFFNGFIEFTKLPVNNSKLIMYPKIIPYLPYLFQQPFCFSVFFLIKIDLTKIKFSLGVLRISLQNFFELLYCFPNTSTPVIGFSKHQSNFSIFRLPSQNLLKFLNCPVKFFLGYTGSPEVIVNFKITWI